VAALFGLGSGGVVQVGGVVWARWRRWAHAAMVFVKSYE
jgi:hypothetical protein